MSDWKKYKKRPLIVKARQLTSDKIIETPEGTMRAKAGDYHVVGVTGEQYLMKAHIFEVSYDEV